VSGRASLPAFTYCAPTTLSFGTDALDKLEGYLAQLGVARALVVCDPRLGAQGVTDRVRQAGGARIRQVFDRVQPDAPLDAIVRAAEEARALAIDGIVAVGGGSTLDTGKAVALLTVHDVDLLGWEGVDRVGGRGLPLVAIPTTAGTGSEATNILVVKDPATSRKISVIDAAVYPEVALLDPRLTVGLPAALTAATGIDALTHAIEGVVSVLHQPVCDAIGLECIRLIRTWLPRALRDGADLGARGFMLLSASMAGQLVSMTMNGVAHAIAHALGAGWGVHHGAGNAIALPWSIRYNCRSPDASAMYARCADAWGLPRLGDDVNTALTFADAVEQFISELGLATRLRAVQLGPSDLRRLAELAYADAAHQPNPVRMAGPEELEVALQSIA
jgi:alcohol dehydrogenase class IV